ncbi:hypothetical protein H6P81_003059 [Aristolochia fimbriata]|uniref:Uncharacterized protein n=1 Tax=Aristolochia fimbriata TaxID=158543 RepID=A0AAV7FFD8_ARIFI|nr:hypothetical protein H6P81_003059 [Aristolochia fimbriata]
MGRCWDGYAERHRFAPPKRRSSSSLSRTEGDEPRRLVGSESRVFGIRFRLPMAAPSVTLINGLRAFYHTVIVGDETILTLALYTDGDASRMTYCPSRESVFGGHAVKPPSLVDRSLPYGSLSRSLATGDRVFFLAPALQKTRQ